MRLFLFGLLTLLSQWSYAAPDRGNSTDDPKKPTDGVHPATPAKPEVAGQTMISLKTLNNLDRAVMNSLSLAERQDLLDRAKSLVVDDVKPDVLSADATAAKALFDGLAASGGIVADDFSSDSFKELPFFVKVGKARTATTGTTSATSATGVNSAQNSRDSTGLLLGISKVTFFPGYVEMAAYVRAYIKGREVFFGIDKLKYVQGAGFAGSAKLILLGNYNFPMGTSMNLQINGGVMSQTGVMSDQTSLEFDCGRFKQISLSATLSLKSDKFVRINETTGAVIPNTPVTTTIRTQIQSFNSFVFDITLPAFSLTKFARKVGFVVQNATFDFSDDMSSSDMRAALVKYDKTYQSETEFAGWRGVYIKTLKVLLPKEIAASRRRPAGSATTTTTTSTTVSNTDPLRAFGTNDLFIDGTGLTFSLFAYNMIPLDQGAAGSWPLSLDSLDLSIKRNEFQRFSMAGRIKLPMASKKGQTASTSTDPKKNPDILTYRGLIDPVLEEYALTIGIGNLSSLNMFGGQATLLPNSYVELRVVQSTFRPKAVLSGTWAFGVNLSGDVSGGAGAASKDVGFKQINFQELTLQNSEPYISVKSFGYKDETNSLGGFPLQIRRIEASFGQNSTRQPTFILGMGLDLTLQSKSLAAKVDGNITWTKTTIDGEDSWDLSGADLNKFTVDADFSAFRLKGNLEFMKKDPIYGDGFKGSLNINVGAAMGSSTSIDVKSIFGRVNSYYYFYLDAMATLPVGIKIGPMELYGLGGGFAINMERNPKKTSDFSMTGMAYEPKKDNFGVMFALAYRTSFDMGKTLEGTGGFMMEMSTSYGLTRIGLFVNAKIGNYGATGMTGNLASTYKTLPVSTAGAMTAKSDAVERPAQSSAIMTANLGIDYNFTTKELIVAGKAYFALPDNSLRGSYENNRVGNVDMYFGASKWYIYVGKPETPLSVTLKQGIFTGSATAYLVTGSVMPAPFTGGAGLGFGAALQGGTGLIRGSIFYAELNFNMGVNFLLQKNVYCANIRQTKDWYATLGVYFGASGRAGVRVAGSDYDIAQASVSANLNAGGMDPLYFNGTLNFYAKVLCSNLTFWYLETNCWWGGWHNTVLHCNSTWKSYTKEVCLFEGGGSIGITVGTKCN